MDFISKLYEFAAKLPDNLEYCKSEEATKQYLVLPFLEILGYDTKKPGEIVPEFDADVGTHKKFKIDYAIFHSGKPIIMVECKPSTNSLETGNEWKQLYHYFVSTETRIGILTNGIRYQFFADLAKPNVMDSMPFLDFELTSLSEDTLKELHKLTKSDFDSDTVIDTASELKYIGGIKKILRRQLSTPDDDFIKFFFKELCPDNFFTGSLKDSFVGYTKSALSEFIRSEIDARLDAISQPDPSRNVQEEVENIEEEEDLSSRTELTQNEIEGFHIVKSILWQEISPERLSHKDTQSYCNILLDQNSWKPIVRLWFNSADNLQLELFKFDEDNERTSHKVHIENLGDIYKYSDELRAVALAYDAGK